MEKMELSEALKANASVLLEAQIYDHDVTICYIVATSVKVKPFKTLAGCSSTVIEGIFIYLLAPIIDTQ